MSYDPIEQEDVGSRIQEVRDIISTGQEDACILPALPRLETILPVKSTQDEVGILMNETWPFLRIPTLKTWIGSSNILSHQWPSSMLKYPRDYKSRIIHNIEQIHVASTKISQMNFGSTVSQYPNLKILNLNFSEEVDLFRDSESCLDQDARGNLRAKLEYLSIPYSSRAILGRRGYMYSHFLCYTALKKLELDVRALLGCNLPKADLKEIRSLGFPTILDSKAAILVKLLPGSLENFRLLFPPTDGGDSAAGYCLWSENSFLHADGLFFGGKDNVSLRFPSLKRVTVSTEPMEEGTLETTAKSASDAGIQFVHDTEHACAEFMIDFNEWFDNSFVQPR